MPAHYSSENGPQFRIDSVPPTSFHWLLELSNFAPHNIELSRRAESTTKSVRRPDCTLPTIRHLRGMLQRFVRFLTRQRAGRNAAASAGTASTQTDARTSVHDVEGPR
jgi:hypothetical protein